MSPSTRGSRSTRSSPRLPAADFLRRWFRRPPATAEPEGEPELELPWRQRWGHVPKRTAGFDFSSGDYRLARARAREVARSTLGEDLWHRLQRQGYLELPSQHYAGVTY